MSLRRGRVPVSLVSGALAASAIAAIYGCSVIEKVSGDQCATAADCTNIGLVGAACTNNVCTGATNAGGAPWACLGHVTNDEDVAATPVTLMFPFLDLVSGDPIVGVEVQACAKLDVSCASPLTGMIASNAEGYVSVPVTAGFDGYLKTSFSGGPPTYCFINPPVIDSTPRDDTDLVTTFDYEVIAKETVDGGAINPAYGTVFSNVGDCNGNNGEAVSVTLDNHDANTTIAYQINGLPTVGATQTDSSGNVVVINVPPGNVTLTATLVSTGQRIGEATGFVRGGAFSYIFVVPSP